jgi:hypothetical protein
MKCPDVAVVTYVLNYHNQERELDAESLLGIKRGINVVGGDISSHDLEDGRLNIGISYPFNVSVSHLFIPDLEGFGSKCKKSHVLDKCSHGLPQAFCQLLKSLDLFPEEGGRLTQSNKEWKGNHSDK